MQNWNSFPQLPKVKWSDLNLHLRMHVNYILRWFPSATKTTFKNMTGHFCVCVCVCVCGMQCFSEKMFTWSQQKQRFCLGTMFFCFTGRWRHVQKGRPFQCSSGNCQSDIYKKVRLIGVETWYVTTMVSKLYCLIFLWPQVMEEPRRLSIQPHRKFIFKQECLNWQERSCTFTLRSGWLKLELTSHVRIQDYGNGKPDIKTRSDPLGTSFWNNLRWEKLSPLGLTIWFCVL